MNAHDSVYNVLFLSNRDSARGIFAEVILDRAGDGRFRAYSAGTQPSEVVDPIALDVLQGLGIETDTLRPRSWEEFSSPDAPRMDFVFPVWDREADEPCPVWPGKAITGPWSIPDPASVEGSEAIRHAAFADTYRMLSNRINLFLNLPQESLNELAKDLRLKEMARASV